MEHKYDDTNGEVTVLLPGLIQRELEDIFGIAASAQENMQKLAGPIEAVLENINVQTQMASIVLPKLPKINLPKLPKTILPDFSGMHNVINECNRALESAHEFFEPVTMSREVLLNNSYSNDRRLSYEDRQLLLTEIRSLMKVRPSYKESNAIILVLTKSGDLHKQNNRSKRYGMSEKSIRLRVVKLLIGQDKYMPSDKIIAAVKCGSRESLAETIRMINIKTQERLNLPKGKPHHLILGKAVSGYMINPLYPIIEGEA